VLWQPSIASDVLQLFAFPVGSLFGAGSINLQKVPGLLQALLTPDGCVHLLYRDARGVMQFCIRGTDLSQPVHLLQDAVAFREGSGVKENLWRQQPILPRCVLSAPNSRPTNPERLGFILQALDGHIAGASYREIAISWFGEDRVRYDWDDGSQYLKDRIRRAVARGGKLVNGGYRRFLTGSRSNVIDSESH